MIVIDSSAVVAIALSEPDEGIYSTCLAAAAAKAMSALNVLETQTVLLGRRGPAAAAAFAEWLVENDVRIVAFDAAMAAAAFRAYSRYGKVIDPKARLNLSDCAAYALAKSLDAPLLFKGADFRHTDVTAAI